jgi:hypothetical protein
MPAWVTDEDDQVRIAAYDAYDDMYGNAPQTFRVAMRGTNDKPIYVPSMKRIVEATNRYLGKGWAWVVSSAGANELDTSNATAWLTQLCAASRMPSKFFSFKRNMVKKGDGIFHVVADLDKAAGQRIRVLELDPRTYFRIDDPRDPERLLGVYIVNLITVGTTSKTTVAMRLEYRYMQPDAQGNSEIGSRLTFWEENGWDDRWPGHPDLKPVPVPDDWADDPLIHGIILPPSVTKLPVYHAVNNRQDEDPWGTSEAAGIETLIAAINQGASDEDITLALQGLGMYITNSAAPVDEEGNETDWIISPGYVIELKGIDKKFERLDGVRTVLPFQDHLDYLGNQMDASSGVTATAVGNVDVSVAASGVALRLDMAPILAKNEEKETELKGVMNEMMTDLLAMWAPVDGVPQGDGLVVTCSFSDPLPIDRAAVILEVTNLVNLGVMSKEFATAYLQTKLGYQFPEGMADQIAKEQDEESARVTAEIGANGPQGGDPSTDPFADPNVGSGGAGGAE